MRALTSLLVALPMLAWVASPASVVVRAQHETAADLLDGERAFKGNCANCHGPDGDQVPGIDLGRGQFRRQLSDDDVTRIIRTGIPGTGMPATTMTQEQAEKIVAYLKSVAATKKTAVIAGDVARGKALYDGKGNCASCHRVANVGSRVGPDLSRIGAQRKSTEIELSLLNPMATVDPTNRFYRVVLKDGTAVTGRLLSHDTFTVQMIDTKEQLRSFVKADLKEFGFTDPPMPSYKDRLTPQEVADVVSYLVSLKTR